MILYFIFSNISIKIFYYQLNYLFNSSNLYRWSTSLVAFTFKNTDHYSLRVLANIPFLSNNKYWLNSDHQSWSLDFPSYLIYNYADPFNHDYWSAFNVYKSPSSSNKHLISHWAYFLIQCILCSLKTVQLIFFISASVKASSPNAGSIIITRS